MRTLALVSCLAIVAAAPCGADDMRVAHLYELSDFNGPVPYSDVILHADRKYSEIYAVVGNNVRVFNQTGMEIYRFQHDPIESKILDLVVDEQGDIFTLNLDPLANSFPTWWINRCDYRGNVIERIVVAGLPEAIDGFAPNRIFYSGGQLVLVSRGDMQVVAVDRSGAFRSWRDLVRLLELENGQSMEIAGFSIDRFGNLLFTIPVLFKAYVVAPDGTFRAFGSPGSSAGRFGIVAGIVASDNGNVVIVDKLRRVVMVFDSTLQLVTEFAGNDKWMLSRPTDLVLGNGGRIYITQSQQRGVAVLSLSPIGGDRAFDIGSVVQKQGL